MSWRIFFRYLTKNRPETLPHKKPEPGNISWSSRSPDLTYLFLILWQIKYGGGGSTQDPLTPLLPVGIQESVNLGTARHGGSSTWTSDRDSRHRAGKLRRLDQIHAFGQGCGEASIESISRARGINDRACVNGRHVGGERVVLDKGSLRAEGEDDVADSAGKECRGSPLG